MSETVFEKECKEFEVLTDYIRHRTVLGSQVTQLIYRALCDFLSSAMFYLI